MTFLGAASDLAAELVDATEEANSDVYAKAQAAVAAGAVLSLSIAFERDPLITFAVEDDGQKHVIGTIPLCNQFASFNLH
jgi:hypothetical protein